MTWPSDLWRPWLAALSAALVTMALGPFVRSIALRVGCVAKPARERWDNRRVVTRLGGVAICGGVLVAVALWVPLTNALAHLLIACVLIVGVGVIDDLWSMRPYIKLVCQLVIGALVVMAGIRIELIQWAWVAVPLSIFWFVLIINAFNLLDNMDGLAAGVGAIAAGVCAVDAATNGQWHMAALAASMIGACAGFLRYNFPPARMYMGDAGSHFLGLVLAALALLSTWTRSTHLIGILAIPVLVLAVPIFDTCFVTIQRLMNGQHPFQGGTDHVSHRLAILGLSQRQTVLTLYGVSAVVGVLGIVSTRLSVFSATVVWLLTLTAILLAAAYLARVRVYEVKREAMVSTAGARRGPATFIETMLLHKRRLLEVVVDFALICSAYVGAHLLRFEGTLSPPYQQLILQSLPLILMIQLGCFSGFGLYRGLWRYVSLPDLLTIFKAVTLGSVFSALAILYVWRFEGYSRAVFIIDWLLLFMGISASRLAERVLNEVIANATQQAAPALIIGAGDMGELVLRHVRQKGSWKRAVIGFLDDDLRKQGTRIQGRAVLGTRAALPDVLRLYRVREVFIAMHRPPTDLVEHVKVACEARGVRWQTITGVTPEAS